MNIFRLLGDLSHVFAIIILFYKIWKTRSCAGVSGKSQILFAVVYLTRYLDLFTTYVSLYNSVMKVLFLSASGATVYLIYGKFKETYDHNHDSFRLELLLIPCALLALVINHEFTLVEVLWTFSIYLESVAIVPQLFLGSKTGKAESIISYYLFALGSYRAMYLVNWVYRYMVESHYDFIAIFAGIVQTILVLATWYVGRISTSEDPEKGFFGNNLPAQISIISTGDGKDVKTSMLTPVDVVVSDSVDPSIISILSTEK